MLRGAEEDDDEQVDVLVDVDGSMCWRKGTITPFVDEGIVSKDYVLMDATPLSCRFMILYQNIDDIVFAGRFFFDDGTANQRGDPRKAVYLSGRTGFIQLAREFGVDTRRGEVCDFGEKGTY